MFKYSNATVIDFNPIRILCYTVLQFRVLYPLVATLNLLDQQAATCDSHSRILLPLLKCELLTFHLITFLQHIQGSQLTSRDAITTTSVRCPCVPLSDNSKKGSASTQLS